MNHLQRNLFFCFHLLAALLIYLLSDLFHLELAWLKLPLLDRFSLIILENLILLYFLYKLNLKYEYLGVLIERNLEHKISNFFIWVVYQANYFYLTYTIQFQHCDIENKAISIFWFKFINFKLVADDIGFCLLVIFVIKTKVCEWKEKKRRRKEFEKLAITRKYSLEEYPEENECSICLVNY